ncbi:hypothetical protein OIU74_019359 [Salix koriyanagi]|uniref:PsbP C-terminal domain-containing protein n=1 Tax=Salix koriyanagi TaxID=2511006 RepID=A0A9Q0P3E4_9ROSI|nr:hypothetical protein OIU74_019359 [Salix koriyanagi]
MACISSLNSLSRRPFNPNFSSFSSNKPADAETGINMLSAATATTNKKKRKNCCKSACTFHGFLSSIVGFDCFCQIVVVLCLGEEPCGAGTKRREALFNMVLTAFTFPAIASTALAATGVAEDLRIYTDDVNKFKISIPQGWQVGSGEPSGYKSVTAFYPEEASNSSVSVVITGLGPDFTRLESFGKVDAFAETLVGGLDRSWQRPPGVAAKLIDSKASNGLYYIEYTLQNPGESRRHLLSALGVAFNGWYNRLYTVTGLFVDEESEKFGTDIRKAVSSFRLI